MTDERPVPKTENKVCKKRPSLQKRDTQLQSQSEETVVIKGGWSNDVKVSKSRSGTMKSGCEVQTIRRGKRNI